MKPYTGSLTDLFPEQLFTEQPPRTFTAPSLPDPHPAEADIFSRFASIPGHHQDNLADARIILVGAGGLNSWVACGLARSGVRDMIIVDPDLVERSNLTRQLYYAPDLAQPKANCLAHNLIEHSVNRARITGIPLRFEEAVERFPLPADLLVVGVDRNDCRLSAVRLARQRHIPVIFTMLSLDGTRCHCFLQGPENEDACLWCALPNLEFDSASPCAASIISSCFLAGAFTTFFIHRALMGWPPGVKPFNWRESDLQCSVPDLTGYIQQRPGCPVCSNLR
jgi:molybdopterin/thiamine biosynthesis adenylyltransferase